MAEKHARLMEFVSLKGLVGALHETKRTERIHLIMEKKKTTRLLPHEKFLLKSRVL